MTKTYLIICLILINSLSGTCQKFLYSNALTDPLTKQPTITTLKIIHSLRQNKIDSLAYFDGTKDIYVNKDFKAKFISAASEISKYSKIHSKAEFVLSWTIDSNHRVIYCSYQDSVESFINLKFYYECSCGKLDDMVIESKEELDAIAKPFNDYKTRNGTDSIPPPPPPPSYDLYKAGQDCFNKANKSDNNK